MLTRCRPLLPDGAGCVRSGAGCPAAPVGVSRCHEVGAWEPGLLHATGAALQPGVTAQRADVPASLPLCTAASHLG